MILLCMHFFFFGWCCVYSPSVLIGFKVQCRAPCYNKYIYINGIIGRELPIKLWLIAEYVRLIGCHYVMSRQKRRNQQICEMKTSALAVSGFCGHTRARARFVCICLCMNVCDGGWDAMRVIKECERDGTTKQEQRFLINTWSWTGH